MLSLTALLLASCAAPSPAYATGEIEDEPRPPRPAPDLPTGRLLTVEEMTSIIQAELVRQPKLTVGEVREYVATRMVEMRRQTVPVVPEAPPAPKASLDMAPAKTRRRRERLAARVSASSMPTP